MVRLSVAATALVLLSALVLAAAPALAKKPAANVTIAAAELKGNSYAFWREKGVITVEDITKNTGTRRAGPSLNRIYLVHGGQQWLLASRAVPALGPGKSHRDESSSDPFAKHEFPIGAYTLRICADAKHHVNAPGTNGCKKMLPRQFFVIASGWIGSMSGVEARSIKDEWRSTDAQFTFDQYEGGGVVSYLYSGSVTWTDSGTDSGGCAVNGTGTRSYNDDASIGALSIDYLKGSYIGNLQDTSGPPFQVTFSGCESPPPPQAGAYEPAFWSPVGTSITGVPMPFGSTSLPGSPLQLNEATWTWSLKAAVSS